MSDKKDWIVTMRCVVIKEVYCFNCTEDEAKDSPWDFADDEVEIGQPDWEIEKIEENI